MMETSELQKVGNYIIRIAKAIGRKLSILAAMVLTKTNTTVWISLL
jgi:hypothetical protein